MKPLLHNNKGIALLTVIILSAVIFMLSLNITLLGISGRGNVFYMTESGKVFVEGEGCAEEALLQLKRNPDYTGGTLTLGTAECTLVVSGSGTERDVNVMATGNGFIRDFVMTVQTEPVFAILNWDE